MKKILSFLIVLALMLPAVASAQTIDSEFPGIQEALEVFRSDPDVINCRENLVPLYDYETGQFLKFLEETFQNKSSNNSLKNLAIARYQEYRKKLEQYYDEKRPVADGAFDENYREQFEAYAKCAEVLETYLAVAKEQMIQHIKATSAQKKTTILIEKLNSINGQLRDMNLAVAQTYSFFATFSNKLPGYVHQCVQS